MFLADAKAAGLSDEEMHRIAVFLSENPLAGDLMRGTGGARKVRFARQNKGKGKSGGYRTIHFFGGADVPVFALAIVDKSERANLSKAERNELRSILSTLADDYRVGVSDKVRAIRR